jgi:hypothetical protein
VGYNRIGFTPLWDTMEEIFLLFGIKRKRFLSIVGYYRRGFFPLWDTMEKNDAMQNNIFKFLVFLIAIK